MDTNILNTMPSYLKIKIKKAAAGEEGDYVEAEDQEKDMEAEERAAEVESKRKKMSLGAAAAPCCVVESCGADLRGCKKYHQKHRVCELHAKAPLVLLDGLTQRFCQQCSRFHDVSEFDETKRSCRRRLAGHNERRRKSSLESSTQKLEENHCRRLNEQTQGHQTIHIHPTH